MRVWLRKRQAEDINVLATSIAQKATKEPTPDKNPATLALGRLSGLKGGKARAEKLPAKNAKK